MQDEALFNFRKRDEEPAESLDKELSLSILDKTFEAFKAKDASKLFCYFSENFKMTVKKQNNSEKTEHILNRQSYINTIVHKFQLTRKFEEYRYELIDHKQLDNLKAITKIKVIEKSIDIAGIEKRSELKENVVIELINGIGYITEVWADETEST